MIKMISSDLLYYKVLPFLDNCRIIIYRISNIDKYYYDKFRKIKLALYDPLLFFNKCCEDTYFRKIFSNLSDSIELMINDKKTKVNYLVGNFDTITLKKNISNQNICWVKNIYFQKIKLKKLCKVINDSSFLENINVYTLEICPHKNSINKTKNLLKMLTNATKKISIDTIKMIYQEKWTTLRWDCHSLLNILLGSSLLCKFYRNKNNFPYDGSIGPCKYEGPDKDLEYSDNVCEEKIYDVRDVQFFYY